MPLVFVDGLMVKTFNVASHNRSRYLLHDDETCGNCHSLAMKNWFEGDNWKHVRHFEAFNIIPKVRELTFCMPYRLLRMFNSTSREKYGHSLIRMSR